MTVLHDVTTASTLGTTVASPLNLTHAAGAGCAGVVVAITVGGVSTDVVTGVTYGGTAMTRIRTDNATSAEAGRTYLYFLGWGKVPQAAGNQTCSIAYGADVTAKSATCTTLKSSYGVKQMTVAQSAGITNSATTTGYKFGIGAAGQGDSSMLFVSAFSGTAGAMSATCPPTPTTNVTTMADDITGTLTGGTFRQTVALESQFAINLVQAADDFCASGLAVVEYATDSDFIFPTPEWDEEDTFFPPPLPDILYTNNFDGVASGTTITTGNSGGSSGRAWDAVTIGGTGASLTYSAASSLTGKGGIGAKATSGSVSDTQFFTWSGLNVRYTDMYTRMYARCDSALGFQIFSQYAGFTRAFMFADSIRLSDASSATRYTGVHVFVRGEPFRIEVYVHSDLVTGHMQARLFWGDNINGTTPNEVVGSLTDNWNLGSPSGQVTMGNLNPTTNTTWSYDSLALSTTTWVGPEIQPEYNDGIWPFPDFDEQGELAAPAAATSQFILTSMVVGAI